MIHFGSLILGQQSHCDISHTVWAESRNQIVDLGTYLHFNYGDNILIKYMSPEAIQKITSLKWMRDLIPVFIIVTSLTG